MGISDIATLYCARLAIACVGASYSDLRGQRSSDSTGLPLDAPAGNTCGASSARCIRQAWSELRCLDAFLHLGEKKNSPEDMSCVTRPAKPSPMSMRAQPKTRPSRQGN